MSKTKTTAGDAGTTIVTEEIKAQPATAKSLRQNAEVETFYRFIHENNLRAEAYTLIKTVLEKVHPKKKKASKGKATKLQ